jgi:AcrR family transcriptional regulator
MGPMVPPVKRRPYDRSRRQAASAVTRRRIMEAARASFLELGYGATTVALIAERAGVNADTVYTLVGRKTVVLRELIEQALSGTDEAVTAEDRDYVRAIRAEPDPRRKLAIYARAIRAIHQRLAPLFVVLRDTSASEPEAAEVWQQISDRRATNMRRLARDLRDAGGLRAGLSIAEAADVLWATNSPDLYVLLTIGRHWSGARYERWLAETWQRLLLPDGADGA